MLQTVKKKKKDVRTFILPWQDHKNSSCKCCALYKKKKKVSYKRMDDE